LLLPHQRGTFLSLLATGYISLRIAWDLQGHLLGIPTLGAVFPEDGSAATGIGFAIASQGVVLVIQSLLKGETLLTA
jgi:hypothetical protein